MLISAAEPLLQVRSLTSGYGKIGILHGVDIDIAVGEVVALLGPNGAGKTTLLRTVSGLLPWTGGTVTYQGRDMARVGPRETARSGIAHVIEGHRVFTQQTVGDNLLLAAYDVPRAERSARIEEALSYFPEIAEKRGALGSTLSGGQQQMALIARALTVGSNCIVFDEILPVDVVGIFRHPVFLSYEEV